MNRTKGWKTSQKIWETEKQEAYLIGYLPDPLSALRVKKEMEKDCGIEVRADIRLIGIVKKEASS